MEKQVWLYLASDSENTATLSDTLGIIQKHHVLWRPSRNVNGALIANVKHLQPGDKVVVGFRQPSPEAYIVAVIREPSKPVSGTSAIQLADKTLGLALREAGYNESNGGYEVILLDNIRSIRFGLAGTYGGNNALHKLAPEDIAKLDS